MEMFRLYVNFVIRCCSCATSIFEIYHGNILRLLIQQPIFLSLKITQEELSNVITINVHGSC